MQISIDKELINKAKKNKGKPDENCVCTFKHKDDKSLIVLDCQNNDYLYSLVVICSDLIHEKIKQILLRWDSTARKEYGQELQDDLNDNSQIQNSLLNAIIESHNIKIF